MQFAGGNIAIQGIFQALGCGIESLVISLLRLLIVVLPLAWIFSQFTNATTVIWLAFPIAEAVALVVALIFMARTNKTIIASMKDKISDSVEIEIERNEAKVLGGYAE